VKKKQLRRSDKFGIPSSRGWFKFHYEKWLTGSVMTELEPDEQAVFVMFLCEAARSGRGGFEIHSRELWARQHNIKSELLDRTIKKCLKFKKIERVFYKRENFEFFWSPKWGHYQGEKSTKKAENTGKKERCGKPTKDDEEKIPRLDEMRIDHIKLDEISSKESQGEDFNDRLLNPKKFSDVDIHLTNLLIEKILENNPKSRVQRMAQKTKEDWHNECRKLREIDSRSPEDIEAVINWCQGDDFEKTVVLSMPKLRERFDSLWLKHERSKAKTNPKDLTSEEKDWIEGKGKYKDE